METLWLPLAAATLDWLSLHRRWDRLQHFTKPAVMLAILVWMQMDGPGWSGPFLYFGIAVGFSLVGDVLLLPAIDRFLPALAAFLVAHLAYIAGLNPTAPPFNFSTLLFALVVGLFFLRAAGRIRSRLLQRGRTAYVLPSLLYAVVLGVMLFSGLAALARPDWPPSQALLAAAGAVGFTLSDLLLSWNRFVEPISNARLKTRVLYHIGQILLVASAFG